MKKASIFYVETLKICAYFLCSSKCVAASRCISMFFNEHAAASKRYHWTTASERKCAADIFFCVAASRNISMFFNERAAAS